MKDSIVVTAIALSLAAACSASPKPEATTPAAASPEPTTAAEPTTVVVTQAPALPSPEETAKAEAQQKLAQERAAMLAEHQAELARWTPELHAEAKAAAEKSYPSGPAAIRAAVAAKYRKPKNVDRDGQRHPVETLGFLGLKPTMTVLEYSPGEGWYTELLAPALASKGKLLATNTDPNGPPEARSSFYGTRFKLFLETSPELYGKVETILVDNAAPKLDRDGTVDMVLVFRSLHGMLNNGQLALWLAEMHKALKPNGVLGIEQHRAKPDAAAETSSKQGYLPEKWVIEQVEAAGFKLAGKSEINANPKDTKDYPEGVWALPPSLRLGAVDREKYSAIGESDRMTLKFVKVAVKAPKAAATALPGAPVTPVAPKASAPAAAPVTPPAAAAATPVAPQPASAATATPATPAAPAKPAAAAKPPVVPAK